MEIRGEEGQESRRGYRVVSLSETRVLHAADLSARVGEGHASGKRPNGREKEWSFSPPFLTGMATKIGGNERKLEVKVGRGESVL